MVVGGCQFVASYYEQIIEFVSPFVAFLTGLTTLDVLILIFMALLVTSVATLTFSPAVWHSFANRIFVGGHVVISMPSVIDGDTIDDLATGVRYRLANIDAPETGEQAKCFREREKGEMAKRMAVRAISAGVRVTARKTFRIDRFGRRVAFVYVDGQDLGEWLVREGFARPWYGFRRKWCGRHGQLQEMAAARGESFSCKTCDRWRHG